MINLKLATPKDTADIWALLQQGILKRKEEGSQQWQDGYPNLETVEHDIAQGFGYVLKHQHQVVAYCALMPHEPAYEAIENGAWLTAEPYIAVHRLVVHEDYLGLGLAKTVLLWVEDWAKGQSITSIKVDTNYDNASMLHIFKVLGYVCCGEVYFRGSSRKAFQKILDREKNK